LNLVERIPSLRKFFKFVGNASDAFKIIKPILERLQILCYRFTAKPEDEHYVEGASFPDSHHNILPLDQYIDPDDDIKRGKFLPGHSFERKSISYGKDKDHYKTLCNHDNNKKPTSGFLPGWLTLHCMCGFYLGKHMMVLYVYKA